MPRWQATLVTDPRRLDSWSPGWSQQSLLDDGPAPWELSQDDESESDAPEVGAQKAAECRVRLDELESMLSPHDLALLRLTKLGCQQTMIGDVLGRAQSTISYSTRRLMGRLRVLASRPKVDSEEMTAYLRRHLTSRESEIMHHMLRDPCHLAIGKLMGLGAPAVRVACGRAVAKLKALADGHHVDDLEMRVYKTFRGVVLNQTLLHTQVRRPIPTLSFAPERKRWVQLDLFAS